MRAVSLIEPLEDRIAPASLVTIGANGKSATYTDSTGDTVVVTTTKGAFTTSQFTFDPSTAGQLTELSIAGIKTFNGASIAFTVFPVNGYPNGSSSVNVGYIDAIGLSLGAVSIPGDLGRIDTGGGPSSIALTRLSVSSLGALSTTQGGLTFPSGSSYDVVSNIVGTLGQLNVTGNIDGTLFAGDYKSVHGTGNINQMTVGGSIDGNVSHLVPGSSTESFYTSGQVLFSGTLGTAVIAGGIEGGPAQFSGTVGGYSSLNGGLGTFSKIGSITVKGSVPDDPNPNPVAGAAGTSILGGTGSVSGGIIADTVGTVSIAGDVDGGIGTGSGFVQGALVLKTVNIAGSLLGGNFNPGSPSEANSSGVISGTTIGSVTIGKNLYGGSGIASGEIFSNSGVIQKVVIMGDLGGGTAGTSTSAGYAGSIRGNALGSITVMGSVIGGNSVAGDPNQAANNGAYIASNTTIGSLYVGGDVTGGSGINSAAISSGAGITTLNIAGANGLVGGAGASTATISAGANLGSLIIRNNVTGGSGADSGLIQVGNQLNSLAIGGNVTGGAANSTGLISIFGVLNKGLINGNIQGSNSGSTMLTNTGYLQANGITNLTVGGSLISGTAGSGGLDTSGAIRSTAAITALTIGSLDGNSTNPAIISAVGPANVPIGATSDVAIGSITVKTSSLYGDILAGYSTNTNNGTVPLGVGVNADAQIGSVTIGTNLTASNIIAGVGTGTGGFFGNSASTALSGAGVSDLPTIISKISRIVISGKVTAPTPSTTDTYGIAAQYIVQASVNGAPIPLTAGADNDTFANSATHALLTGGNGNTTLYEV
jgi:hypothetical protein